MSPPHPWASEGRGHRTPSGEPTQNLRTRPAPRAPGLALRVHGDRARGRRREAGGGRPAAAILPKLLAWCAEAPGAGSAWTPDTDRNERLRGNPPGSLLEIQHLGAHPRPPVSQCEFLLGLQAISVHCWSADSSLGTPLVAPRLTATLQCGGRGFHPWPGNQDRTG